MSDNNKINELYFIADICWRCNNDRQFSTTCICSKINYLGTVYPPIKFGEEKNSDYKDMDRCYDCNVIKGGFHHNGCEAEECPRCGGPMLICGCPYR